MTGLCARVRACVTRSSSVLWEPPSQDPLWPGTLRAFSGVSRRLPRDHRGRGPAGRARGGRPQALGAFPEGGVREDRQRLLQVCGPLQRGGGTWVPGLGTCIWYSCPPGPWGPAGPRPGALTWEASIPMGGGNGGAPDVPVPGLRPPANGRLAVAQRWSWEGPQESGRDTDRHRWVPTDGGLWTSPRGSGFIAGHGGRKERGPGRQDGKLSAGRAPWPESGRPSDEAGPARAGREAARPGAGAGGLGFQSRPGPRLGKSHHPDLVGSRPESLHKPKTLQSLRPNRTLRTGGSLKPKCRTLTRSPQEGDILSSSSEGHLEFKKQWTGD